MQSSLGLLDLLKTVMPFKHWELTILLVFLSSFTLHAQGQSAIPIKLWDKTLGSSVDDYLNAMVATSDGGYLLGGYSFQGLEGGSESNPGQQDYVVIKVDKDGNKEWSKTLGGDKYDFLSAMVATLDGGYLLGGYSLSGISGDKSEESRGGYDYWIIKIDKDGNKEWDKTFGGNGDDLLYSLIQTADGGYLLGGNSDSDKGSDKTDAGKGLFDYWIIKINSNGDKVWDKDYGGTDFDYFKSIVAASDGGYLLGGYSQSGAGGDKSDTSRGMYDYWIVKIDDSGNKAWDKTFGGSKLDELISMITTEDGGYILGGDSYSEIGGDKSEANNGFNDYWVIKIDQDGNKKWDKTFGGKSGDYFAALVATPDSGYILGGSSASGIGGDKSEANKGSDYWLVKTDSNGKKIWDKTFGGPGNDELHTIVTTPDHGYLLAGKSNSAIGGDKSEPSQGSYDFWILKLQGEAIKQIQSIAFDSIPDHTFGDTAFSITAKASSDLPLTFTIISGPATIADSVVTLTGTGIVTIEASQQGDSVYNPAPAVNRSFRINKAMPVITWNPANAVEGMQLSESQLNATAAFKGMPVAGAFVYTPPAGTILNSGSQVLAADFTPVDTANFNTVLNSTRTITVSSNTSPAITYFAPSAGPSGSFVFIMGENLSKTMAVSFNGVSAAYMILNNYFLIATVPVGATTGFISIKDINNNDIVFNQSVFNITYALPDVHFFIPATGSAGTLVTIVGENFGEATQVLFNGLATSNFKVLNAYILEVLVPTGATTGAITVVTPRGSGSSSYNFIVTDKGVLVAEQRGANINEEERTAIVYPNPFKNSFTLSLEGSYQEKLPAILYNMEGKVMLKIPNILSGQQIETGSKLTPGVYILEVGVGKDSKKYKLIKSF